MRTHAFLVALLFCAALAGRAELGLGSSTHAEVLKGLEGGEVLLVTPAP